MPFNTQARSQQTSLMACAHLVDFFFTLFPTADSHKHTTTILQFSWFQKSLCQAASRGDTVPETQSNTHTHTHTSQWVHGTS